MVMFFDSLLPSWLPSPANVAVAVQPFADVTLVQSPLYTTETGALSPPTPVTFALAAKADARYVYGPASNASAVDEDAFVIVMLFESLLPSWLASPANGAVPGHALFEVTFVQAPL